MPAPLPSPQHVVLHIGTGKTGTSTLQRFLSRNRARLAADGLLYPRTPGRTRHTALGLYIRSDAQVERTLGWHRSGHTSVPEFRRRFRRRLFREIERAGSTSVLFSDEALYGAPERAIVRLHRFTTRFAASTTVVAYLRRQDDHLISLYQQEVKVGETRRLTEWAARDWTSYYDYRARLERFRAQMGPAIVVRRFEPARFRDGDLVADFLEAAGVSTPLSELRPVDPRNESLGAEAVEFLRLLNVHRRSGEGVRKVEIDNREHVRRLAEAARGPALTLPDAQLDAFMAPWEEPNRAVAREFLGDPTGELFTPSRRSHGVTTEQRLAPARIDDFVELLGLPDDVRDPLRDLARSGE